MNKGKFYLFLAFQHLYIHYLKLKILAFGEIKKQIEISAHFASKQALSKIEKAGGKINIIKK